MTRLILDTNWVLDLWVFDDPRAAALREALAAGRCQWLACEPMLDELARVLTYPAVAQRLLDGGRDLTTVLGQIRQQAQLVDVPPRHVLRCDDPDDQVFVDLAMHHRTTLLSKDRAVLRLRRRMLDWGVTVSDRWPCASAIPKK